jgi:hypothetical protein
MSSQTNTDRGSVATNCYARSRGHWPAGKRRNAINAHRFIAALLHEFSARDVARMAGVSDRTIRRWAIGEDWATEDSCHKIVAALFSSEPQGSLPIYSPDMALDGNTRCGGVGEYTLRSARPPVSKTYDTLRLIVRSGCVSAFME